MKINLPLVGISITGLLVMFGLSGCTGNGPQFTAPQKASKGNGMLYVYRQSRFVGGGMHYDVKVDNHIIGSMDNGEYIARELSPGTKTVSAKTEVTVTTPVVIQKNTMTCVKAGVGFGILVGRPTLKLVDNTTCLKEIKNTVKSVD